MPSPPTIGGERHYISRLSPRSSGNSVRCQSFPLTRISRATIISVLSGRISMNLGTHIRHVHWNFRKCFQGQRSKVKVITRWHTLPAEGQPTTYLRPSVRFFERRRHIIISTLWRRDWIWIVSMFYRVEFLWLRAPMVYFLTLLFYNIPFKLRKPPRRLECFGCHCFSRFSVYNSRKRSIVESRHWNDDFCAKKTVDIGSLDFLQLLKKCNGTYPAFDERNMKCSIV